MINLRKNRGITLIALVITIIVMLILVAVTINIAINGGLFDYAARAAKETEEKKQVELEYINITPGGTYENMIDKYSEKQIITFYFVNTPYQAEDGMTWVEWVNDENYNKTGFTISMGRVYPPRGGYVVSQPNSSTGVDLSKPIIADYHYEESNAK